MTDTENWSDVVFTGLVDEFVGRIGEVDTELPLTVFFRVVLCCHLKIICLQFTTVLDNI